jgi:organizing structure protein 2
LNIYDEPEPEIVLVESPSRLEVNIALAQKYVNNTYDNGMVRAVHEIDAALATEG